MLVTAEIVCLKGGYSTKYRSKGAERGGGGGEEEIGSDGDDGTMDEIRQQQEDSNTLAAKVHYEPAPLPNYYNCYCSIL